MYIFWLKLFLFSYPPRQMNKSNWGWRRKLGRSNSPTQPHGNFHTDLKGKYGTKLINFNKISIYDLSTEECWLYISRKPLV